MNVGKGIYGFNGKPWLKITIESQAEIDSLKYGFNAQPWYGYGVVIPITGHILSINGVPWEHVKSYNGIEQSHIKTAMGVEG